MNSQSWEAMIGKAMNAAPNIATLILVKNTS